MTPQAQTQRREWPRQAEQDHARPTTIKAELAKYLLAMIVAALTSYFATIYAIKEEVAVLKVHVEYLRKQVDAQTAAIERLTASVNAHTLAHGKQP